MPRAKEMFPNNPVNNILELYGISAQDILISIITKLLQKMSQELLKNLRPRILGNYEILEKSQISLETW